MKLADIKRQIIDAYFSSTGEGVSEAQLETFTDELLTIVNGEDVFTAEELIEHEDPTIAYRSLMKEDVAVGYAMDSDTALYAVVNLTSPNKAVRSSSLREVREAFLQAPEHNSASIFKVKTARITRVG